MKQLSNDEVSTLCRELAYLLHAGMGNADALTLMADDGGKHRTLLEGMIDIPYSNIIGMDVAYEATGQGDTDGLDYVYQAGDEVVRTDRLIIKNLKMNQNRMTPRSTFQFPPLLIVTKTLLQLHSQVQNPHSHSHSHSHCHHQQL